MTRARSGATEAKAIAAANATKTDGASPRSDSPNITTVRANPTEIKEKMEQQLRQQRAAHQQKRALESGQAQVVKMASGQVVKIVPSSQGECTASKRTAFEEEVPLCLEVIVVCFL